MLTHSSAASPETFLMTFSRCGSSTVGVICRAAIVDVLVNVFPMEPRLRASTPMTLPVAVGIIGRPLR